MTKHSVKGYEDENDETIVKNINLEEDHQPNNSTDDHHPVDNDNDDEKLDEKRKKKKKKSKERDRDREKKHRDGSREKDKEKEKDKERDREKEKEKTSKDNNKIEKRHRADSPIDKLDNNHEEPRKKKNLSRDRERDRDVDRDRRRRSPSPAYRRRSSSPRRRYDSRDRDRKDRDSNNRHHGDREKDREREKSRVAGGYDKDKVKVPKDEEENVVVESSENLEGKSSEDKIKSSVNDDESSKKTATTGDKVKEAAAREAGSSRDRERDRRGRSDKERSDRDRGGRSRQSPSPRYRRRSPSPRSYRQRSPDRRDRDRDYDRRGGDGGAAGYRGGGGSGSSRRSGRSSERDRNREKSKDREDSRDRDRKKGDDDRSSSSSSSSSSDSSKPKPLSLKDIISAYPGISIAEAAQRLNAHNSALALGLPPPSTIGEYMAAAAGYGSSSGSSAAVTAGAGGVAMMGNSMGAIQIAGLGGLVGEGGALTKPHRELYVGNIPPGTTVPQLADFLNAIMKQLGLTTSTTGCIITAWVSTDGHYAFVEFRTIEETLGALQYLNGLQIGAHVLKVGRPKGYNSGGGSAVSVPMGMVSQQLGINMAGVSAAGAALGNLGSLSLGSSSLASIMGSAAVAPAGLSGLGMMSGMSGLSNPMITTSSTSSMFNNGMNNSNNQMISNVIMVTNLPLGINEEQVRELVSTFGEIQAFNLIKTADTAQSAVLEYVDKAVTDDAILGLNKLEIANYRLAVQRVPAESAAILLQPIHSARNGSSSSSTTATTAAVSVTQGPPVDPLASLPPTRVLRLSNMTVDEDLIDDELYEELKEDIAEECGKYGDVQVIIIPRLTQYGGDAAITDVSQEAAVGQIFLQYSTMAGAEVARKAVAGRSFNGKIVLAYFYPEELFVKKIYVIPAGYFNTSPSPTPSTSAPVSVQQQVPQPSANPMEDPDSYFNDIDEMD